MLLYAGAVFSIVHLILGISCFRSFILQTQSLSVVLFAYSRLLNEVLWPAWRAFHFPSVNPMYTLSGFDSVEATPLYITFVFWQFIPSNGQFSLFLQLHLVSIMVSLFHNIFLLCLFIICVMFSVVLQLTFSVFRLNILCKLFSRGKCLSTS